MRENWSLTGSTFPQRTIDGSPIARCNSFRCKITQRCFLRKSLHFRSSPRLFSISLLMTELYYSYIDLLLSNSLKWRKSRVKKPAREPLEAGFRGCLIRGSYFYDYFIYLENENFTLVQSRASATNAEKSRKAVSSSQLSSSFEKVSGPSLDV